MPLISYSEAAAQIELAIRALQNESVSASYETAPLTSALGRVLAEPVRADRDQPPFPRSTRDGFAARAAEANTHQFLRLTGQIRAGESNPQSIPPGQAWEIMTGAAVPQGADAVFMVEHSEVSSLGEGPEKPVQDPAQKSVRLQPSRTLHPGENIVPQGAEAYAGESIIPTGTRLAASHIALAAQCGYPQLAVFPRPRVAILATGDELVPVEATPGPHQIRNSNSPMLAALVASAGGEPWVLPPANDTAEALDFSLQQATEADLLLISGGISVGLFDLVDEALNRAGAVFQFRGVAMQPGKPVAFGQFPGKSGRMMPVFALPGNPISSAVTFRLFAGPLLAALGGEANPRPRFAQATLAKNWSGKPGLTRFLPAFCDFGATGMGAEVSPIAWQGSGDLAAFSRSNCCLVIPAEAETILAGTTVEILLS
jgi:molybdopterin molybdotransferase